MLKKMAWNTFKNTGNIDTMLEILQMKNIQEENKEKVELKNIGINNENINTK